MFSPSVPKENNSREKLYIDKEIERMMDTYGQDISKIWQLQGTEQRKNMDNSDNHKPLQGLFKKLLDKKSFIARQRYG